MSQGCESLTFRGGKKVNKAVKNRTTNVTKRPQVREEMTYSMRSFQGKKNNYVLVGEEEAVQASRHKYMLF